MLNPVSTFAAVTKRSTNVKPAMSAQVAQRCQRGAINPDSTLQQEVLNVKNVQKVINAFNQMRYLSNVLLVNTEF
jgi:hypothetical protein